MDLTRQQLLAYRHGLQHGEPGIGVAVPPLSEATRTQATSGSSLDANNHRVE
ncbi:Integrase (plasmid) [Cupriavidus sp. U2]|uniref:hypothetical protein n=1 Tax=Cupriavidus sp. U2 TaxID=2920269 RepID=UPI00129E2473|nr:hypothetical protein [Cupriavidus sp. U2]KAI3590365.1 Integrase [Cupriavidus sp. U2]